MRTIALVLGASGGLASALLGLQWLDQASRQRSYATLAAAIGQDPGRLEIAAYMLVAALIAGVFGGILAYRGEGKTAAVVLLVGGLAPGLVDPRAFVVTCVLVLAGILSVELRAARRVPLLSRDSISHSLG